MQFAFRSLFIVVLAATGFFAATALPSSATGTEPVRGTAIAAKQVIAAEKADFSTLRGIKRYLRAIGVDPRSVVIQRGKRNYAGSNCPGAAWNCTNAQQVMQLGTQNTFECVATTTPSPPAPSITPTNTPGFQQCVIVQGPALGATNVARCIQKSKHVPMLTQRCSISQSGRHNEATIVQVADQTVGTTQGALQEVGIFQNATGSTNRLQIDQEIKQLTETTGAGVTQDQDAYQVVRDLLTSPASAQLPAIQQAVADGDNASQIVQKQIQRAKGGMTQKQNDGIAAFEPEDCNPTTSVAGPSVAFPNACVNLAQTAANGTNHQGQLSQLIDQEATTTAAAIPSPPAVIDQQQGPRLTGPTTPQPAPFEGGADGRVHQMITGLSGTSQNQAHQSETLKLFAPPGTTQTQSGGASCCGVGSQDGGVDNEEQITQGKLLEAVGGTEQVATLLGATRSPQGDCTINHSVQTNSDQATASESAEPCVALAVITVCENTDGNGDPEVGACQEAVVCEAGETPDLDVGEGGDIDASCDEGNGDPTLNTVTDPIPLSQGPLDSASRTKRLSSLER